MTDTSFELALSRDISDAETEKILSDMVQRNIMDVCLRVPAHGQWYNRSVPSTWRGRIHDFNQIAEAYGVATHIELHTYWTRWTARDGTSPPFIWDSLDNRERYLDYVENAISQLDHSNIETVWWANEPPALTGRDYENAHLLDIIDVAHDAGSVGGIKFMGGYSPDTGRYASQIDREVDIIMRNIYWKPGDPAHGVTDSVMDNMVANAQSRGKSLWITEFGNRGGQVEQADYIETVKIWLTSRGVPHAYVWIADTWMDEPYNIFSNSRLDFKVAIEAIANTGVPPPPPPPPECSTFNDCITQFGVAPPGKDWMCEDGFCVVVDECVAGGNCAVKYGFPADGFHWECQDGGCIQVANDVPPPPPPPPPPSRTLAARMLPPQSIAVGCLRALRNRLLTKEQHKKLHPVV